MQSQPSLQGSHKVCLQLPDAGRVIMQQPKPCKSPSILTNGRGTLGDMLHGTCQILWELGGVCWSKPACGVLAFSTRPRVVWRTSQHLRMGWSRSRQLRGLPGPPPRLCTAPQLLHARRRLWLGECFPCCTGACHVVLRFCDDFECGRF